MKKVSKKIIDSSRKLFGKKDLTYIKSQKELDALVDILSEKNVIAIDTEFTRRTTYYPELSIIQIAVKISPKEKKYFIVDYKIKLNFSEFFELMSNSHLKKIIHASSQDLIALHYESGVVVKGVMDTQLMANLCGVGFNSGYSTLVKNLLKKKLNKDQQNSDWQNRPLTKEQIKYALNDVVYLEEIYQKLLDLLISQNRLEWYFEEIEDYTKTSLFRSDEYLFQRLSFKGKSAKQIQQIKNLISWRESYAKNMNITRQRIIRDEAIDFLVTNDFEKFRFSKRFDSKMIGEVKEILQRDEEVDFNSKKPMTASQKRSYERAKEFLNKTARREKIESQLLLTVPDLKRLVTDPLFFDKKICGWRYQLFGDQLKEILG